MQIRGIHLPVGQVITSKGRPLQDTENAFQVYICFAYRDIFSWRFSLFFVEHGRVIVKQKTQLYGFYRWVKSFTSQQRR